LINTNGNDCAWGHLRCDFLRVAQSEGDRIPLSGLLDSNYPQPSSFFFAYAALRFNYWWHGWHGSCGGQRFIDSYPCRSKLNESHSPPFAEARLSKTFPGFESSKFRSGELGDSRSSVGDSLCWPHLDVTDSPDSVREAIALHESAVAQNVIAVVSPGVFPAISCSMVRPAIERFGYCPVKG
jgi:hypothetical protein